MGRELSGTGYNPFIPMLTDRNSNGRPFIPYLFQKDEGAFTFV
ncbi:MAG TPA: hypothetical protein PK735_05585 [Flavobacteriales bacterium]|nr:hypothetical protein [Flavobacteriales bacterium]HQX31512.1 hypothetical protein [Flavobacteriales bacterium]HQX39807.1 hypothetical protein [Flavobacteriales bacterium]HQZ42339.1 hypothetical protein [Flavobacteriales bacterium]HQZ94288.1 hypothetical protein [Flavobacteriales bacterium]